MTSAIALLLASLLIIGIVRTFKESREEIPTDQEIESVDQDETPEKLPEPQAEIIIENPPYQTESKKGTVKTAQKKEPAAAKKTSVKKSPAKKTPIKKSTAKK